MSGNVCKILVVHDDPEVRDRLVGLLAAGPDGWQVTGAAVGIEAGQVDCLVAGDVADAGLADCPVVIVSDDPSGGARQTALRAGAMEYLAGAGVGSELLVHGVASAMARHRLAREADERQLEGEKQLAMTLEAGRLGFWDWDVPSGRVFFGGHWASMIGYGPDELEPHLQSWERLVHPDDLERANRLLAEHLAGGSKFYECEHRLRHKDGSWRWVLDRGQVVARDAAGKPLRALGTHTDITSRKLSEERLRESEERFRLLVEISSQIVWEATSDGSFAVDSPSWRNFTGQSLDEWLGNGWINVVHPDDVAGVTAAWRSALRDVSVLRRQFRIRRADGCWRWTQVVATPLYDCSGRLLKWVGMNTDVTEQRESENRLRESESFYRQTLESIPGMTFTNNPQGDCDFVSQQWIEFTGMSFEDHLGSGWTRALHRDDRAASYELWLSVVAAGHDFETKYRVRRHDGVYKWFKVRGRAIRDSAGQIDRWSGAAVNVDDLVRAEEALREADRHKDEFLAMLAHELRNPLAPILNAVQILRLTGQGAGSPGGVHEVIERQVQHMVRLVDDLLDVSRVSSGRIQLRKCPLDLVAVVQHAVDTHRSAISARHHELALMLPADPLRVDGDFIRLAQVVGNLLNNAAKYSDDGGKLYLSVEREAREGEAPLAVVRVRDTGRGIDPAVLPRVFDLFYQVDRTIDRSDGGLGIGLSLAKSLVTMHGGTIEAHSAGRGHGSEFVVRLPVLPEPADEGRPAGGVPATAATAASGSGLRVLVVDDNIDSAESMTLLLRLKGHDVRTAHDGEQAVASALAERPEVVLLDIGLPKLNGYDACRRMREGGLRDTLIVAMTGYGQPEDRRRSLEAGFDIHLVKPVDLGAVLELLERKAVPPSV